MSTFPTQAPDVGQSRRRATPIPRAPGPEQLAAPGLAVAPPTITAGQRMALELAESLGVATSLAYTARGLSQDEINRREREAAEQARIDREARALHEGNASAAARVDFQTLQNDILTGKIARPADMDTEAFVASIIEARSTGQPAEYADAYRRALEPGLLGAVYAKDRQNEADQLRQDIGLLTERAIVATDAATITDSMAQARKLDPTITETDALTNIAKPALEAAAAAGDEVRFPAAMAAIGDRLPAERRHYQAVYDAKKAEEKNGRERAALNDLYGLVNKGDFTSALDRVDGSAGMIDEQSRLQMRGVILNRDQDRTVDGWHSMILTGAKTPEEVEAMARAAAAIPYGQLGHVDGAIGRQFVVEAKKIVKAKLDQEQVSNVLRGGPGILTKSQHGEALASALGSEGLGFIDETNRIVQPEALGAAILTARVLPTPVAQTMLTQLGSANPAEAAAAGQAIGAVSASNRLYAELVDQTPEPMRPALTAAVDAFRSGKFASDQDRLAAVDRVRSALAAQQEKKQATAQSVAEVRRSLGDNYDVTVADSILEAARLDLPHTTDTALGLDWLNPDPSFDVTQVGQDVHEFTRSAYMDEYARLQGTFPTTLADAMARKFADGKVRNAVDFVRWNNELRPVLVDQGIGLRMPEALRWGDGFEDEARTDIAAARPDLDVDDLTPIPFLDPVVKDGENPEDVMGWAFVDDAGAPVTDAKGRRLIYRPSDKAAKANADFRSLLAKKETGFFKVKAAEKGPALPPIMNFR